MPRDSHPPPKTVRAMQRLVEDVLALKALCASDKPPLRLMRPKFMHALIYGFADASGAAFGAAFQNATEAKVRYEYGQWISSVSEEESSNWKELANLVESLEGKEADGSLTGSEVFMFTDNSTAEAAFWKGTSSSPKLRELVLRLRQL